VFISRGLQLEGQVVTEEQDLQVMVMMSQKNSPVQYVHASAMQHRVRAAVAQSQASTTSKFLLRLISQRRPWESHDSSGMFGYMIPEASTLNSSLTMTF
jgi:hypothetical protein